MPDKPLNAQRSAEGQQGSAVGPQYERRLLATHIADKIVRKFPQIEQAVIAPALRREIAVAVLKVLSGESPLRSRDDQKDDAQGLQAIQSIGGVCEP